MKGHRLRFAVLAVPALCFPAPAKEEAKKKPTLSVDATPITQGVKPGLVATLLGTMIFTWFIILHIPRVIASPVAYMGSEVTSALIALAYGGIAFVIAGTVKSEQVVLT